MAELGVFLPVIRNGWVISTAAPQYEPSYADNKAMTLLAERLGFGFVLTAVKYKGFGGPTGHWDSALESFEVMAALAEATSRIQLFGSVAVPTIHPAITARRAATIDHISNGRFGLNIVSGWQKDEYVSLGLWPGDEHFARRYDYSREYVKVMKLLWTERDVDFDGDFFHLQGARVLPHPSRQMPLVCAGQSDTGLKFTAENGDYAFIMVDVAATNQKLRQYAEAAGRDVGSYALYTVVPGETEADANRKAALWTEHADQEALATMMGLSALDTNEGSIAQLKGAAFMGFTKIVGSYAQCAEQLDEAGAIEGTTGMMLIFPECLQGLQEFGENVLPLMHNATLHTTDPAAARPAEAVAAHS
jgi:pyrimidine oxygenase